MTKYNREAKQFFSKLHQDLAVKYNITPHLVLYIRSEILGFRKSRKEVAEILVKKLQYCLINHHTPKKHLQSSLNFVASCSDEVWKDLAQKTKFDK